MWRRGKESWDIFIIFLSETLKCFVSSLTQTRTTQTYESRAILRGMKKKSKCLFFISLEFTAVSGATWHHLPYCCTCMNVLKRHSVCTFPRIKIWAQNTALLRFHALYQQVLGRDEPAPAWSACHVQSPFSTSSCQKCQGCDNSVILHAKASVLRHWDVKW